MIWMKPLSLSLFGSEIFKLRILQFDEIPTQRFKQKERFPSYHRHESIEKILGVFRYEHKNWFGGNKYLI